MKAKLEIKRRTLAAHSAWRRVDPKVMREQALRDISPL